MECTSIKSNTQDVVEQSLTVKQDLEYDEIKELLLQIKEEVEGGL